MGLHLHSAACEAYLTGPDDDYDDPSLNVEYPRETKNPRKLDRDRIRWLARLVRQNRGPFVNDRGFIIDLSPAQRFHHLASTRYERINLALGNAPTRRDELLRVWRIKIAQAHRCSKVPLP